LHPRTKVDLLSVWVTGDIFSIFSKKRRHNAKTWRYECGLKILGSTRGDANGRQCWSKDRHPNVRRLFLNFI